MCPTRRSRKRRYREIITVSYGEVIQIDSKKVQVVKEWKAPMNMHDVRCFLGMGNYYRKFIEWYIHIVVPITKLLRKEVKLEWKSS